MERVIVTVKREGEARVRDLEVPAEVEARRLADLIASALRWQTDAAGQRMAYEIEAHPLGRRLAPTETLAEAGVWDGSWLVLHSARAQSSSAAISLTRPRDSLPDASAAPLPEGGVVTGWRALRVDTDHSTAAEAPPRKTMGDELKNSGYGWKLLD